LSIHVKKALETPEKVLKECGMIRDFPKIPFFTYLPPPKPTNLPMEVFLSVRTLIGFFSFILNDSLACLFCKEQ
jgi:hypothetical protein